MKKITEIIDNDENFKVLLEELSNKIHTDTQSHDN